MSKGIYTNTELIGTIISDINDVIKEVASGQYIQACRIITQVTQKLVNLRNTIDNDLKNKDQVIEDLKRCLVESGIDIKDVDPRELIPGVTDKPVDSGI